MGKKDNPMNLSLQPPESTNMLSYTIERDLRSLDWFWKVYAPYYSFQASKCRHREGLHIPAWIGEILGYSSFV